MILFRIIKSNLSSSKGFPPPEFVSTNQHMNYQEIINKPAIPKI